MEVMKNKQEPQQQLVQNVIHRVLQQGEKRER